MWWRLPESQFMQQRGQINRTAFKRIVDSGQVPGILAYLQGKPVGWCSVAPREVFPRLERSRTLKRVNDDPVWSVVCFYVAKGFRGKGISTRLLKAALEHVGRRGGMIVEGYPVDPKKDGTSAAVVYMGLASAFRKVGFVEVCRWSENRPIMRFMIRANRSGASARLERVSNA